MNIYSSFRLDASGDPIYATTLGTSSDCVPIGHTIKTITKFKDGEESILFLIRAHLIDIQRCEKRRKLENTLPKSICYT